ncbi:MAG: putative glycolipid-binding domain-containing protein [Chloroflexota bacterium]
MKQRTVVWKAVEYEGLEYLKVTDAKGIISVNSVVLGGRKQAFRLDYQLLCDHRYTVQGVSLLLNNEQQIFHKHGQNWIDQAGKPLPPQFDGCIDVDITATPFTNTLPIRRINWNVGQSEDLKMLYISIPDLALSVSNQRYTCLEKSAEGGLFRFELIDDDGSVSFTALLPVDADGLVIDYPGLFQRVWSDRWNV